MAQQDVLAPNGQKWEAREFIRSTHLFCQAVARAITPLLPDELSLDLYVTIRKGKVRIRPQPLYEGEGWTNHSGG